MKGNWLYMFWHINLAKYHAAIRNEDIAGHFIAQENIWEIILIEKSMSLICRWISKSGKKQPHKILLLYKAYQENASIQKVAPDCRLEALIPENSRDSNKAQWGTRLAPGHSPSQQDRQAWILAPTPRSCPHPSSILAKAPWHWVLRQGGGGARMRQPPAATPSAPSASFPYSAIASLGPQVLI